MSLAVDSMTRGLSNSGWAASLPIVPLTTAMANCFGWKPKFGEMNLRVRCLILSIRRASKLLGGLRTFIEYRTTYQVITGVMDRPKPEMSLEDRNRLICPSSICMRAQGRDGYGWLTSQFVKTRMVVVVCQDPRDVSRQGTLSNSRTHTDPGGLVKCSTSDLRIARCRALRHQTSEAPEWGYRNLRLYARVPKASVYSRVL